MEQQTFTILMAILGGVFAILSGLFGPYISGWFARRLQRSQQKHDASAPTPPTTQQVWERMDRMEARANELEDIMGAAVGALAEVADQWTGPHPKISPRFRAVLEKHGHLPEQWKEDQ